MFTALLTGGREQDGACRYFKVHSDGHSIRMRIADGGSTRVGLRDCAVFLHMPEVDHFLSRAKVVPGLENTVLPY